MWWIIAFVFVLFIIIKKFVLNKLTISGLNNKHVFVTGCDTGFGHLLALKLVDNGIPTFAGCLTEKGKSELELKARTSPGQLWTLLLDVTKDDSMLKAAEFVKSQLDGQSLWGLVCNAGIASINAPDDWLNVDHYKKVMEVNSYGVIRTCHAFKPLIKKAKGRIVIITSICARVCLPNVGPYSVSKFAVGAYADVLRLESKAFGFTVHILEPGFFKTNLISPETIVKGFCNLWDNLSEETKQEYGERYFEKAKRAINSSLPNIVNENLNLVVDAYYHALTARFPRLRYQVGADSKFIFIPLSFYPTFLQDIIVGLMMKTQNAPLPDACLKM